eukprot:gene29604-31151_t
MNYADQINAFMGEYNEVKNDFLQGESVKTQGGEQLQQQSDIEFGAVSVKQAIGDEVIAFGKKAYSAIKNTATAETGAAFGLDDVLSAVPLVGAVATVITAIVSAFAGHHEIKNANSDFTMPDSNVDLPSYHPGIN